MEFYVFPQLEELGIVAHAFTTRRGGVSGAPYSTLNMACHVGDDPAAVAENRRRALAALGLESRSQARISQGPGQRPRPIYPASPLVAGEQVHGDKIAVVTEADRGREWAPWAPAITRTDGLITRARGGPEGVVLIAYFADCVPVYLVDPVERAIGLVHAGWRGTALRIVQKGVRAMKDAFGTDPKNVYAGIGPSIGPCCYHVGRDVAWEVAKTVDAPCAGRGGGGCGEDDADNAASQMGGGERWHLDLWEANRLQLLAAGVPAANIFVAGICTCCHRDVFFSYRGNGPRTGRMAALLTVLPHAPAENILAMVRAAEVYDSDINDVHRR